MEKKLLFVASLLRPAKYTTWIAIFLILHTKTWSCPFSSDVHATETTKFGKVESRSHLEVACRMFLKCRVIFCTTGFDMKWTLSILLILSLNCSSMNQTSLLQSTKMFISARPPSVRRNHQGMWTIYTVSRNNYTLLDMFLRFFQCKTVKEPQGHALYNRVALSKPNSRQSVWLCKFYACKHFNSQNSDVKVGLYALYVVSKAFFVFPQCCVPGQHVVPHDQLEYAVYHQVQIYWHDDFSLGGLTVLALFLKRRKAVCHLTLQCHPPSCSFNQHPSFLNCLLPQEKPGYFIKKGGWSRKLNKAN